MLAALNTLHRQAGDPEDCLTAFTDALYLDQGRISGSWFEPAALGPDTSTASGGESFPVEYRGEVLAVPEPAAPARRESTPHPP